MLKALSDFNDRKELHEQPEFKVFHEPQERQARSDILEPKAFRVRKVSNEYNETLERSETPEQNETLDQSDYKE